MNDQVKNTSVQNDDDEIDLLELFHTLLSGKWQIISMAILSLLLALVYAFGQEPIYKADTLMQVESQKKGIPGLEDLAGLGGDDVSVGTELEIIKSRKILGQAVKALKLDIVAQPKRIPLLGTFYKHLFNSDSIEKPFSLFDKYAWGKERIQINRLDVDDKLLNQSLSLISKSDNGFEILSGDKILLAGKVGEYVFSSENNIGINIAELISQEGTVFSISKLSTLNAIEKLKKSIKASEKGKKTGIISLTLEGKNKKLIVNTLDHISKTYLQQSKTRSSEEASNALTFLDEQIKPVREKAETAEANIKKYRTLNQTADMSMETQAVLNVVTSIDTELQKLSLKRSELAQRFKPNHPTLQAISSQELSLKQRKKQTLSKISALPETQQELLTLERDYKVANSIYIDLLNNIQEFKIAKASSVGNVYIIDTAAVHDKPVKPKKSMILALGGLLGAMLGVLIVFLRKALHHYVDNPEKLEELTNIPVYATVPFSKDVNETRGIKKDKKQKTLLAIDNPTDPAIESLRSLRTSLHFALLEAKNNIVMITGPSPGIGKSFISSNFAAVIASSEQRVLLIDADMRKGYLHNLLNKNVSPGLSDLISDNVTLEEVIHTVQVGENNLDIITRGQTPPNPSELLMHSNFEKLLDKLSGMYDLILIDTPPVHAVTDPSIIGKHSGTTFMVIRSNQHNMKEIEHAMTRLAHTGIETKGFIFNAYIAPKNGYGGYGYHSYYGDYKSD
jgi:tyrosine-protein kinase Etk/Wzc